MEAIEYKFRGLPCNCENHDLLDIRWYIGGHFQGMSGVLEWCESFVDAYEIKIQMQKFCTEQDHIEIGMYGIDNHDQSEIINHSKRYFNVGDQIVVIDNYAIYPQYTIFRVCDAFEHQSDNREMLIVKPLINCRYDGQDHLSFEPADKYLLNIHEVLGIYKRKSGTIKQRPRNFHRSLKLMNPECEFSTLCIELIKLPFTPLRNLHLGAINRFFEQYPQSPTRRFNKKLFKRWVRQNWSKLGPK